MSMAVTDDGDPFAHLSIDEIFTRHSVHSVHFLRGEYHASVNKAKAELHSLVGRKYRDLIQIAEDINQMNDTAKTIDDQLTDLSYKASTHVLFESNNFVKFERRLREENAKAARFASRDTIFNNVLNNKLLCFDLKLQSSSNINSHSLVHMARVYFTMESVFETNSKTASTGRTMTQYKANFNEYLEKRIASWLPSSLKLDSAENRIIKTSDGQWLDTDSIDFLESSIEEEHEESSELETQNEGGRYFERSISPLSNYIVAYIILNDRDAIFSSMENVAEKIIELRFKYLKNRIANALESNTQNISNIDFSFIMAFAESTYSWIKRYFCESGTSDVLTLLHRTLEWKVYDYIGFHNWFEEESIVFNDAKYVLIKEDFLESPRIKSNNFVEYLRDTFIKIASCEDVNNSLKRAEEVLSMFYNFVTACRKAEIIAESNGNNCLCVDALSKEDLPIELFEFVVSSVQDLASKEKNFILENVWNQISDDSAKLSKIGIASHNLFDETTIHLMDENFEDYFGRVLSLPFSHVPDENNIEEEVSLKTLRQWFINQESFLSLILDSKISLVTRIHNMLSKLYPSLKNFILWGKFTVSMPRLRFLEVAKQRANSIKIEVNKLLDETLQLTQSDMNDPIKEKLHFLLNLLHLLRVNTHLYEDVSIESKMNDAFSNIFARLFDNLWVQIKSSDEHNAYELLASFSTFESSEGNGTVPLYPHIIVNSSVEIISSMLLTSDYLSSNELFEILTHAENKPIFVEAKNSWIKNILLKERLLESASLCCQSETENLTEDIKRPFDEEKNVAKMDAKISTQNSIKNDETSVVNAVDSSGACDSIEKLEPTNVDETSGCTPVDEPVLNETKPALAVEDLSNITPQLQFETNGDPQIFKKRLTVGQSRQFMANVAFLLCFINEVPLTPQLSLVVEYVGRVNALSMNEIEASTLEFILRGANEFYKSCEDIYLPLLVH